MEEIIELEQLCQICRDDDIDYRILPCKHFICKSCADKINNNQCPLCTMTISLMESDDNVILPISKRGADALKKLMTTPDYSCKAILFIITKLFLVASLIMACFVMFPDSRYSALWMISVVGILECITALAYIPDRNTYVMFILTAVSIFSPIYISITVTWQIPGVVERITIIVYSILTLVYGICLAAYTHRQKIEKQNN